MKIRLQVSISFVIILVFLTLLLGSFFFYKAISIQFQEMRAKLEGLAVSIASSVDGDLHLTLKNKEDMKSDYYLLLRKRFIKIITDYPSIKYIYTMIKSDDKNYFEFVVDSSIPADYNNNGKIDDVEGVTSIGEKYYIADNNDIQRAFANATSDKKISRDKWGEFLSGYAPIYDSQGNVVAILGVDISASNIRKSQSQMILSILILSISSIVLSLILSFLFSDKLTKPIIHLANSAKIIGDGNLDHLIDLKRDDEIGLLADTMNLMTLNLKDNISKLKILYEASNLLSSVLDLNESLKMALNLVFEITKAKRGLIVLNDRSERKVEIAISEGINNIKFVSNECFVDMKKFDLELGDEFISMIKQKPVIFHKSDYDFDERFDTIQNWLETTNCSLCIPLIYKGNLNGFFIIETDLRDYSFLSTLIHQVGLSIENARLYSEAITDGLTGLYIHRYFELQLESEFQRSKRYRSEFSLLMIDIDKFKNINDTHGHQIGDQIIKVISRIIKQTLRSVDLVFRYGGDEIAVILPETSKDNAFIVAEKLRESVSSHLFVNDINVTLSIGISHCDKEYIHSKEFLLKEADMALYKAKSLGRNRTVSGKTVFE